MGDPIKMQTDCGLGALVQLRAYLARHRLPPNARLPAERELGDLLGVSRGDLRKALAILEKEGEVWRHVGKGTFVGSRPADELLSFGQISEQTSPAEVMRTRILFEPVVAREAALHATPEDIHAMRKCLAASRRARSWRHYESWDNSLHTIIAQASRNTLLLALYNALNTVRRAVVWGQLRTAAEGPLGSHHSFAEHESIVDAIEHRDREAAAATMAAHLISVQRHMLEAHRARPERPKRYTGTGKRYPSQGQQRPLRPLDREE